MASAFGIVSRCRIGSQDLASFVWVVIPNVRFSMIDGYNARVRIFPVYTTASPVNLALVTVSVDFFALILSGHQLLDSMRSQNIWGNQIVRAYLGD